MTIEITKTISKVEVVGPDRNVQVTERNNITELGSTISTFHKTYLKVNGDDMSEFPDWVQNIAAAAWSSS